MQSNQIIIGASSFLLGVTACLLCIHPTGNDERLDSAQLPEKPKTRIKHPSSLKNSTRFRRDRAQHDKIPNSTNDLIDIKTIRPFLSMSLNHLRNDTELIIRGLSLSDAKEVSSATNEAANAVLQLEAKLVTLKTDSEGNQFLLIPPHPEQSAKIIEQLETRFRNVFPDQTSSFLAEVASQELYGVAHTRNDQHTRKLYSTTSVNNSLNWVDSIINDQGEEISAYFHPHHKGIPEQYTHLLKSVGIVDRNTLIESHR